MEAIARSVSEVWPGPAVVVAHSIAGYFGWRLGTQRRFTVRGLVLVSAHLFSVSELISNPFCRGVARLRLALGYALMMSLLKPPRFLRALVDRSAGVRRIVTWPLLSPAFLDSSSGVGECFSGNGGTGGLRMVAQARHIDLLATARASEIPTSFVFGTSDPLLTDADNSVMAGLGGISAVWQVEDAGHFPMVEAPGVVASAIMEQLGASAPGSLDGRLANSGGEPGRQLTAAP